VTDNTLIALAERCEAATGPDWKLDGLIADELSDWENLGGHWEQHKVSGERRRTSYPPAPLYTASIDAAMTLVPEGYRVTSLAETVVECDQPWRAILWERRQNPKRRPFGDGATAALALCAAALRARASTLKSREIDNGPE
jgi:hypothetical protein